MKAVSFNFYFMSKLQFFNNPDFGTIRTTVINDEPWFVAKDIAQALGYTNPRKAIIDHVLDEDKKDGVTFRDSIGRDQTPIIINESGVYALIFGSKLPKAKDFKHWVTSEVIPLIRKHYNTKTSDEFENIFPTNIKASSDIAMTSLDVAEITGKEHKNVVRDIRRILEQGANQLNFELVNYKDKKGEERAMYNLTAKGVLILASGYNVLLREKIIDRLEEWETGKRTNNLPSYQIDDPIKRAQKWIEEQQARQVLEAKVTESQKQLEEQAPKVAFAEAITSSSNSCLIGELAKLIKQACERKGIKINIGQNRFFQWLRDNNYLGKSRGYRNIANQEYIEQGLFELKKSTHDKNGILVTTTTTKVTGHGQSYFINGFLSGKFKIE